MKPAYSYNYYYDFIIQYDFINVFQHKRLQGLPKLQKFVVFFNKPHSINFLTHFAFSQLLTTTKGKIKVKVQSFNNLKATVKQKTISAAFELKRNSLFKLLSKLRKDIFSFKKARIEIDLKKLNVNNNLFIYKLDKLILFDLMKNNYSLFKTLETSKLLFLSLISNTKNIEELLFLYSSYRLLQFK